MTSAFPLRVAQAVARDVLDPARMRAALARERGRSDRTGEPFALLMLDHAGTGASSDALDALVADLERRLRCTDELGVVDDDRFGVLLPHTSGLHAARVLRAVLEKGPAARLPGEWQVYTYEPLSSRAELSPFGTSVVVEDSVIRPMDQLFIRPLPPWKRAIDIVGASIGLVLSAPLLLGAAALIRLSSGGPAIFRQQRTGLGGARFTMYKLRTMTLDAEAQQAGLSARGAMDGPAFKLAADPRVIPFGRFLRTTSIDELPQFWNVLKGDMSLVGPRPLPCHESAACRPWQRARLDVTPGMTGLWQVSGRSNIAFEPWVRMDLEYARTRSPLRDLVLLARTIPAVLFKRGSL
jgi:lipopolysaccharide/colanic/teichoic acid biosynthesis glycosyltransferase